MRERIRVLHVDDEPDFADLTATFLEREGDRFSVETATDAEEGLEQLRENEYDCVVSDYDMPGKDGIEFLEQVREEYPELPFVLFTGKGSEEVASDAISAGVTDYLQKGTGTEQYELLANRISNATERYLAQREADWHRKVIESMGEGVYIVDSDHVLRFVNLRMRREIVPEEDLIGRPLSFFADAQIISEEELNEVKKGIDRVLTDETEEVRVELHPGLPKSEQTELRLREFRVDGEKLALGTTRDITEQKRRERELTRSRELLRHTEEIARTGGWETDAETGEQRWTEGTYEIGDTQPDADFDPTLEKSLEFYHPDDRDDAKAAIEDCIENGESFEEEFRLITSEDRLRWAKVAGEPVTENGEVTLVRGGIQDITEHKNREKELRELKERLDLVVEAAGLGVWDWDIESGEIEHNEQWAEMFGMPPEEGTVSVESIRERSHPDRVSELEEVIEEVITGKRDRYDIEIRRKTADGDWKWVRTVGQVAERDENGKATRLVGVNIDIDELKRQKKELERYKTFVESSSDVITHVDVDGTVLYQSPAVEDTFGYEQDEMVGDNVFEYAHPDDRQKISEKFYSVLEDPERESGKQEYRARDGDGEYIWMEGVGKDQRDTEAGGVVINQRDITERKRREKELERQNKRLEEFASVVSHDLRNPLSVAKGRLELAREDCDSEHLNRVDDALERMDALIEDILTLAREGSDVGEMEVIETEEMVEDCWSNVGTETATLVNELEKKVEADPRRSKQLCENLLRNAVEHGGDDVTVTVGELEDGNGFYIADDGEGIPEEEREEVFETGYSTSEDGTGLGLRIVKQVVEAHGWDIEVTESEDGGARFEISGVGASETA